MNWVFAEKKSISQFVAQHLQEERIRVQHGMAAAADPNAAAAHQQVQQQQVRFDLRLKSDLFLHVRVVLFRKKGRLKIEE